MNDRDRETDFNLEKQKAKATMAKGSKAVATRADTANAVAQQGARNAYQQFGDEVRQTGIEGDLLRFNKQGEWIAGQEEDEIALGTRVVMGLNVLKRGWVKWEDNKPTDSRMGLVSEGFRPANREELGDLDEDEWEEDDDGNKRDPWQNTTQLLLLGEDDGRVFTYTTSSKSGKTALGEASIEYGNRLQDGQDAEAMPVVALQKSFYKHKKYGKVMIPVFELTGEWVTPPERQEPKETSKKSTAKKAAKPAGKSNGAAAGKGGKGPAALPPPRKSGGKGNASRI